MTYYGDTGEFHFEFGLDSCGSSFTGWGGVPGTDGQGNCFFEYDSYAQFGEKAGHWDINWEGVATDCYPTASGCTGAPTNNLELAAHFGGPLGINGLTGAGNLVFAYDAGTNGWMISGSGTGIEVPLDSSMSDVTEMSYVPNYAASNTPTPTQFTLSTSIASYGGSVGTFTVPAGQLGIVGITCMTSNCSDLGTQMRLRLKYNTSPDLMYCGNLSISLSTPFQYSSSLYLENGNSTTLVEITS